MAGIERVTDIVSGLVFGIVANADDDFRPQCGGGDAAGVAEARRTGGALGGRVVEVPMDEAAVVADGGEQVSALRRAVEFESDCLFDA